MYNIIIVSHSNRMRCFMKRFFDRFDINKRFMNCAIIKICNKNNNIKAELIYSGELDNEEDKDNEKYYTYKNYRTLTTNKLNIPENMIYYIVRHGQGYHNLANSILDKILYAFESPYFNDPNLTNKGFEQSRHAGIFLNNYINKEYTTIFFCSKLLRTRETISEIMDQMGFMKNNIYILPSSHEIMLIERNGLCDGNQFLPEIGHNVGIIPKNNHETKKLKFLQINNKKIIWYFYDKFYNKNKLCRHTNMLYEAIYILNKIIQ